MSNNAVARVTCSAASLGRCSSLQAEKKRLQNRIKIQFSVRNLTVNCFFKFDTKTKFFLNSCSDRDKIRIF